MITGRADSSHYDVDIDPFVKVQGQKKPKGLLRAIWEQLCREQLEGTGLAQVDPAWRAGFEACVYDGRRNVFTPSELPIPRGSSS